jgi:hypothetical protein
MTISLRAAGTLAANATSVNPSFPAGGQASDLNILAVYVKPTGGTTPSNVTINTPANWTKLGQWSNGNFAPASPPAGTGSTIVAIYARVGAFSGALGAITGTNISNMAAAINIYQKTTGNWEIFALTHGEDVSGTTYNSSTDVASADMGLASGNWLLAATCAGNNTAFASPTLTVAGLTLGTVNARQSAGSSVASPSSQTWADFRDVSVTSGTDTAGPVVTSTTNLNGVTAFVALKEATTSLNSTETATMTDRVIGVPQLRSWQNEEKVMAADMNRQISEPLRWHRGETRPGIMLRGTQTQALAAGSETQLRWNSHIVQTGQIWYHVGQPYVYVGEPGTYNGSISVSIEDVGTMNNGWDLVTKLYVYRNNAVNSTIENQAPDMSTEQSFVIGGAPFTVYLKAGDFLVVGVTGGWSSGGARIWGGAPDIETQLDLWWDSGWEG